MRTRIAPLVRLSAVLLLVLTSVAAPLVAMEGSAGPRLAPVPGTTGDAIEGPFAPGRLLVRFRDVAPEGMRQAVLAQAGVSVERTLASLGVQVVMVPPGQELAIAKQLKRNLTVQYAEPDYLYRTFDAAAIPDDPYYASDQWNLPQINAPAAWDITTGATDVIIAVTDTGVDLGHPDLSAKVVAGYDFVNDDSDPQDDEGHGSHVAGIAAASTNNGVGVTGVSWGAKIMPVKVLDNGGSGYVSDIVEGMQWAADHGAKIINMSMGGSSPSTPLQDAVNYVYAHGLIVVAAAGNSYQEGNPTSYPAAFPHVIAVAASDDQDGHASYSNTGGYIDVAAPGGDPTGSDDANPRHWIMSTYWRGAAAAGGAAPQAAYERHAGTSMAAPHVAGLAALVWSRHPEWTNDQVEWAIESTAYDAGEEGWDEVFGYGRIDARAAVALGALPPTPTPTPATCLVESPHPYPDGANLTWTVTNPDPEANFTRVRFSRIELESGYDFVILKDGSGNEIQRFTGNRSAVRSNIIPGRTVQVQLTSDSSATGWGFCLNRIETAPPPAWEIRAPLGLPRSRLAVAAVNGKLYAIGGESPDTTQAQAGEPRLERMAEVAGVQAYAGRVEEYDPVANSWTTRSPMPRPLSNVSSAVIGDAIYLPGGWDSAPTAVLQIYAPATDRWTTGAALPMTLTSAAVAELNGQLFVMGGSTTTAALDTCFRYDPAADRWATCGQLHRARMFAGAAGLNGRLYVVGGVDESGADLADVEEYDPATDRWTPKTPLRTARGGPGVAAAGGFLYVVGGGWQSYLATAERYDPQADRWEVVDSLSVGRRTLGLAELDGRLYAVGGYNGGYSAVNEALTLVRPARPDLRLSPAAFAVTVIAGEAATRTLTLGNTGQMTLTFDIRTVAAPPAAFSRQVGDSGAASPRPGVDAGAPDLSGGSAPVKTPLQPGDSGIIVQPATASAPLTDTLRVLVISSDPDISDLLAALNAFPDVQATRFTGPGVPVLADLDAYPIVLTSDNRQWAASGMDPAALGDLLAGYVDRGGVVVVASYGYDWGGWGIGGRFAQGSYSPFDRATRDLNQPVTLGITLTGHPLLQDVAALGDTAIHQNPTLAAGGSLVASWDDGTPLVATKTSVVGLNLLPSLGNGAHRWSGDVPALLHNSVVWLASGGRGGGVPWLAVAPAAGLVAPDGRAAVTVAFDATHLLTGTYTATLLVNSNDPTRSLSRLPVILHVVPPPPQVEVTPTSLAVTMATDRTTHRALTLRNTGRGELTFAIIETTRLIPTSAVAAPTEVAGHAISVVEPKAAEGTAAPSASTSTGGGPDPFGYVYRTSAEADGPTYGWVEIAPPAGGSGVEIAGLTGRDDAYYWPLTLPFSFDFYGTAYNQLAVGTNGVLYFEDEYLGTANTTIPSANTYEINRYIAHLWDDLVVAPGAVYTLAEPDRFIIEYYQVRGYSSTSDSAIWQVIFFRNGNLLFQYQTTSLGGGRDHGSQATVGIQGDTSTGLLYSYNAPSLSDGLAICFAYPRQSPACGGGSSGGLSWLTASPAAGTVAPGGVLPLDVRFDTTGLAVGAYGANLVITTNDPARPRLSLPITLTVAPTGGEVLLAVAPAAVQVAPGDLFTVELRISAGRQPLDVVDALLSFDPAVLHVVDASGADATNITPGDRFSSVLRNHADNAAGRIAFGASRQPGEPAPEGDFVLATIAFRAVGETDLAGSALRFLPGSDVFYEGDSVLRALADSCAWVLWPYLPGRATLQGRGSAPSDRWGGYALAVIFTTPGDAQPAASYAALLDRGGVFTATHVLTGTYDVTIKNAHSLSVRRAGVAVDRGMPLLDFGTLLEGDASDDDRVAGDDYSIVVTAYGATPGQPAWDPRADFNGDAAINGADLSLLITNYGRSGAGEQRSGGVGEQRSGGAGERGSGGAGEGGAVLSLAAPAGVVAPGAVFAVAIVLRAGEESVDSMDAIISFDPARLQVVDSTGKLAAAIQAGAALPVVLQNAADSRAGQIRFSAGRQPGGAGPAGTMVVATAYFRAAVSAQNTGAFYRTAGSTFIAFAAGAGVYGRGVSVLGEQQGSVVSLAAGRAFYLPLIGQ